MADSTEAKSLNGELRSSERIDQVDIARAEEEFYALSRQLTARAEAAEKGSQLSVSTRAGKDWEKGDNVQEVFDLREYLTSSNDANQSAGIKHKVRNIFGYVWTVI
jgi:ATP-binding cassette subfamily G (WHITE) protein 2 (SNQ2)